jgi:hypothetical protein
MDFLGHFSTPWLDNFPVFGFCRYAECSIELFLRPYLAGDEGVYPRIDQ